MSGDKACSRGNYTVQKWLAERVIMTRCNHAVNDPRLPQLIRRWYRYHCIGFVLGHVLPREESSCPYSLPCRGSKGGSIEVGIYQRKATMHLILNGLAIQLLGFAYVNTDKYHEDFKALCNSGFCWYQPNVTSVDSNSAALNDCHALNTITNHNITFQAVEWCYPRSTYSNWSSAPRCSRRWSD